MMLLKKIIGLLNKIFWMKSAILLKCAGASIGDSVKRNSWVLNQSILSNLKIWNNVWFGAWNIVNALNGIEIGNDVVISDYCCFVSTDHESKDLWIPIINQGYTIGEDQKIIISDWVWVGFNVVVTKWVKVGKNAIIWAGSVVTRNVPENAIAVWVPAKVIWFRS